MSRLAQLTEAGMETGEVQLCAHDAMVMSALFEAGPTLMTHERDVPLPWSEIAAWAAASGAALESGDITLLPLMSRAYLGGRAEGEKPMGIDPTRADDDAAELARA